MKKLLWLLVALPLITFAQSTSQTNIDFKITEIYSTGYGPGNIVSADFNSDHVPDLALADNNGSTVSILLNAGLGDSSFSTMNAFSVVNPVFIVAAYIDADTNADIAVATIFNLNYYITIYLGAGDGITFTPTDTAYALDGPPKWMAIADFNRDSFLDLATANSSDAPNGGTINILQGLGAAGFGPAVSYDAGTYPSSLDTGDFNGDNYPDLAVTNLGDNTVNVFLFTGQATPGQSSYMGFQGVPSTYPTGVEPWCIKTGNFNNDKYMDFVVANSGDGTINIYLNNQDSVGTFLPSINDTISRNGNLWSVIAADFNRDSIQDLAITSRDSGLTVLKGLNTGHFAKVWNYSDTLVSYTPLYFPLFLIAQDLNNDSLPDITVVNHTRNNLVVFKDTTYLHTVPNSARSSIFSVSGSTVNVYPVPATELINVDSKYKIEKLTLYDIQGRVVVSSQQSSISVATLPAGIYLLYITTSQGTIIKQVAVTTQ